MDTFKTPQDIINELKKIEIKEQKKICEKCGNKSITDKGVCWVCNINEQLKGIRNIRKIVG